MARDRANLRTDMISDDDYRKLTRDEQWLYASVLLIHPTLSYAGVADWRPGRLAAIAAGTTSDDIRRIGQGLQEKYFIYIDEDTEEVFIRSFVKHDGLLKQYRLPISMANDYAGISSQKIREFFIHELKKIYESDPNMKCWENDRVKNLLDRDSKDMKTLSYGDALPIDLGNDHAKGYGKGYAIDPSEGYGLATATTTSTSTSTPKGVEGSGERQSRAVRLPDGWQPTDAHKKFAAENSLNLDNEIANFRDHAQANDRRQKNWDASFRMWLRKATEYQARRTAQPSQHMTASQRRLQEGYEREQRILNGELSFDNPDNPYLQPRPPRQAIEGGNPWTTEQP